jgi:hypothetical protein
MKAGHAALSLALVLLLVAIPAPTAAAFDTFNSPDDGIDTCFTGHNRWDAQYRRDSMNAAVADWENQVVNLVIDHLPTGTCPNSAWVELDWINNLDGALAKTSWSFSGPDWIRFAVNDGDGVPWDWSWDDTPSASEYDFESTAVHELGHALGLKHPENDGTYPYKSWDGLTPVMKEASAVKGTTSRRTLKEDDLAGGYWSKSRQWVPKPEMTNLGYWTAVNGTIDECDPGVACLRQGSGGTPRMYLTIRFTVDQRVERSTPTITVRWEEGAGADGHIDIQFQARSVAADGTTGAWQTSISGNCYDSSSGWVDCVATLGLGFTRTQVMDLRVEVHNHTGGTVRVERVEAVDG